MIDDASSALFASMILSTKTKITRGGTSGMLEHKYLRVCDLHKQAHLNLKKFIWIVSLLLSFILRIFSFILSFVLRILSSILRI